MSGSIRSVKIHYFLASAPLGSLGPLLPIFLNYGKGFTESQFGALIAMTAMSMVLTPVLLALLADTRMDSRRLLAGAYVVGGLALLGIYFAQGVMLVSILYAIYSLAFVPTLPLTDALYFSVAREAEQEGRKISPFQFVRIWGTIGFFVPSLLLYFLLKDSDGAEVIMLVATGWCVLAAANTFTLPQIRLSGAVGFKGRASLPTADALKTLFGPGTRVFCFAMFLAFMSAITYYNLFPLYLKEIAGVPDESVGLVINLGVVIEVFFMLGFGPIRRKLRLKGVLVLGILAMVLRMSLLATFPSVWTALAVQVLHGMEALALYVVPVMYIDRLAGDSFRSSIQGAYMMTVLACSRMLGALVSGWIGEGSVIAAFYFATGVSSVALLVLVFVFKPVPVKD
jgi:PPP family 3-phenylpropionic acid transporter